MDSRTLFLGDLSCFCVESDLIQLFSNCGEIEALRLMKSEHSRKCLGYGFITFKSDFSAMIALRLDGALFMGRNIKVNRAYSTKSQVNPTQPRQKKPKQDENSGAQIHFSYLSEQPTALVTEQTIRNIFMEFGVVEDVSIKRTQTNNNSRIQHGYGFIRFRRDRNEVGAALQAVSVICQVDINHVLYDCCLTRSFEASIVLPPSYQSSSTSSYKIQEGFELIIDSPRSDGLSSISSDLSDEVTTFSTYYHQQSPRLNSDFSTKYCSEATYSMWY